MQIVAFLAVTALGLFVAWLFGLWRSLFDNLETAFLSWMAIMVVYAVIYDRLEARKRRAGAETTEEPR